VKETLLSTRNWLQQETSQGGDFVVKQSTIAVLDAQIRKLHSKIEAITSRINELHDLITNQFASLKKVGYRIQSIFVHRGQATFGHYWVYINDFETGTFRKYNDEYITEVPRDEVFDDTEENTATPYFLVFVREDLAKDYISTVVRKPLPSSGVEQNANKNSAKVDSLANTESSSQKSTEILVNIDQQDDEVNEYSRKKTVEDSNMLVDVTSTQD
jgi:hypothetical protein